MNSPYELMELLAFIKTEARTRGKYKTEWIEWSAQQKRINIILSVGDIKPIASLKCSVWQAKCSNGRRCKRIRGKRITPLRWWKDDDNQIVIIGVKLSELDISYSYIQIMLRVCGLFGTIENSMNVMAILR